MEQKMNIIDLETHEILLFDGVCNLCNGAINFVIKHDKKDAFRFASLQSDIGRELLTKYKIDSQHIDSVILIEKGKVYTKSSAALRASKDLNAAFPLLYGFMLVPKFIRNGIYDFIARNRYKWFGKKESCMIPTPELREKFLDSM